MLLIYMLIIAINQMMWITFAPITTDAAGFYQVSDLKIGMLSMCFMIVFIAVSIPASWIIDRYGIRVGVGTGAVLTGFFGLVRGFAGSDYTLLLLAQIGIGVGQPFLLNAITKMAARWFPLSERATASGLATLSMYLGILAGMLLTPILVGRYGIPSMLYAVGITSTVIAGVFLLFMREKPPTPSGVTDEEEQALVLRGFRHTLNTRDFRWLMLIFFIGLGVFNAVTTWIETILGPHGFSATQAGLTGGMMILGGIVGAMIVPMLSDRLRRRTPFIIIALAGATMGLIGITFTHSYAILLTSSAIMGFFLLSSGPIGFQYGAEITYPVSEGTSNGLLLLMGQISGIALIFGMDYFKSPGSGSMTKPLLFLIAGMVLCVFVSFMLKESLLLRNQGLLNGEDPAHEKIVP